MRIVSTKQQLCPAVRTCKLVVCHLVAPWSCSCTKLGHVGAMIALKFDRLVNEKVCLCMCVCMLKLNLQDAIVCNAKLVLHIDMPMPFSMMPKVSTGKPPVACGIGIRTLNVVL